MGDKHLVRFEPVGIEIEVDEDQTVLRAAAEQGLMLMHGCKEGQCSACKSFVLDGDDIELDRYSTFALPDYEKEEGHTLLCRAHPYEDLTIELLNYDEEIIRSGRVTVNAETITDPARNVEGGAEAIAADLEWLGLAWDEGPLRQSERSVRHLRTQWALRTLCCVNDVRHQ